MLAVCTCAQAGVCRMCCRCCSTTLTMHTLWWARYTCPCHSPCMHEHWHMRRCTAQVWPVLCHWPVPMPVLQSIGKSSLAHLLVQMRQDESAVRTSMSAACCSKHLAVLSEANACICSRHTRWYVRKCRRYLHAANQNAHYAFPFGRVANL